MSGKPEIKDLKKLKEEYFLYITSFGYANLELLTDLEIMTWDEFLNERVYVE